jgi:hypothetical protein
MSLTMRLWQKGEHKTRVLSGLISSDVTDDGAQARREKGFRSTHRLPQASRTEKPNHHIPHHTP